MRHMLANKRNLFIVSIGFALSGTAVAGPIPSSQPIGPSTQAINPPTQIESGAACVEDCATNPFFAEGRGALQPVWRSDSWSVEIGLYETDKAPGNDSIVKDHVTVDFNYEIESEKAGALQLGFRFLQNVSGDDLLESANNAQGGSMQLGWQFGAFSTRFANRFGSAADPSAAFFIATPNEAHQFDLDLAWQTSEHSQVVIGARNLFGDSDERDQAATKLSPTLGRVPYIQYKQDF